MRHGYMFKVDDFCQCRGRQRPPFLGIQPPQLEIEVKVSNVSIGSVRIGFLTLPRCKM